jgi:hypothetical protein
VITRREIVRALERQALADWVVIERDQELAVLDGRRGPGEPGAQREEHRTRWQLTIHADTPAGRGTSRVVIDAHDGDPDQIVADAARLARLSVGPAWTTLPQAAPARVELADPALVKGTALQAAGELAERLPQRAGATLETRITLLRERVAMQSRTGFQTAWHATLARLEALVIVADRSLEVIREARRADGLELGATIDDAIADLRLLASAGDRRRRRSSHRATLDPEQRRRALRRALRAGRRRRRCGADVHARRPGHRRRPRARPA